MAWTTILRLAFLASAAIAVAGAAGCATPLIAPDATGPAVALQTIGSPQVKDGRARFREIVCAVQANHGRAFPNERDCNDILHRLPDEGGGGGRLVEVGAFPRLASSTVLFVPGIFGECVEDTVTPFSDAYDWLRSQGIDARPIHLSGRSSSAANALTLRDAISSEKARKVILVAYSKGASDVIEMLGFHPEIASRIAAVVSVSGVIGGTPVADGYAKAYSTLLANLPFSKCQPGDLGGVESLTRAHRSRWLAEHVLPSSIHFYSVVAFAPATEISAPLRNFRDQLAFVDPRNDGQVIYSDAVFPGGTLLGYVRADHWAVALPFSSAKAPWPMLVDQNRFPRVVLVESILRYLAEDAGS